MPENEFDNFSLEDQEEQTPYADAQELYGKRLNPIPVPERNIGIDVDNQFPEAVVEAAEYSKLDLSTIESFSQISQNRNL